jgi:hypothetical protein
MLTIIEGAVARHHHPEYPYLSRLSRKTDYLRHVHPQYGEQVQAVQILMKMKITDHQWTLDITDIYII